MNEQTQHRLAGLLRLVLIFGGVMALALGYGLWWAGRMLIDNGCEPGWVGTGSPCQQTLLALQNQYLAALIAGIVALLAAGVMTYLHRRALRGESEDA